METQALTRERGGYRLTRPIQAIEMPATVQVILAARIDRLPADDKQLLQTASVIGKDVPFVLRVMPSAAMMRRARASLSVWLEGRYLTGRPNARASATDASFSRPVTSSTCRPKSFSSTPVARRYRFRPSA